MSRFKEMGTGRKIVFTVALIVFLVALGVILQHYIRGAVEQNDFNKLQVNGGHDLEALYKDNSDLAGWVEVKDTKIDYPVMQTINEPEYYLRRNFEKKDSLAGTPFLDASSKIGVSENYLIYGHNMKNGTMFHQLLKYEEKDFYKEHKTFTYDEVRKGKQVNGTYEVVAAFRTQIYSEDSKEFKYYEYPYIGDKKQYEQYVEGIKALSLYDTGITPEYGEQLVTLSTCAYHVDDGRFAVVGRKIK
ncbi:MAG: class B sortase [Eubacteriaceae bacterium]|nr:class B sortase [Eubacteriaceae bacterium]